MLTLIDTGTISDFFQPIATTWLFDYISSFLFDVMLKSPNLTTMTTLQAFCFEAVMIISKTGTAV